jgi:hypothetical protein
MARRAFAQAQKVKRWTKPARVTIAYGGSWLAGKAVVQRPTSFGRIRFYRKNTSQIGLLLSSLFCLK